MMTALHLTRASVWTLTCFAAAMLAACGGGDDGEESTDSAAPATASESGHAHAASFSAARTAPSKATSSAAKVPATTALAHPAAATSSGPPTAGWVKVATEGQSFTVNPTQAVRYGSGSLWVQASVGGTAICSNAYFGIDPNHGVTKQCYVAPATTVTNPGPGVFVDAVAGSDNNPGTFALPWQTLAKASTASVKTGEGIYLMCGETWRESLTLNTTQLASGAILAGYGPCGTSKATISGANDFSTGWTKSGQIWSRSVPSNTPLITRLFVDGNPMRVAQWPNAVAGKNFALSSTSTTASTTTLLVASADMPALSGKTLVGASMQIRQGGAVIAPSTIKSYNASTGLITLATPAPYAIVAQSGYVIQNELWALDSAGEFYHDQVHGKLYVWPTSSAAQSNINASLVEGSVRGTVLEIDNAANLQLSNIAADKGSLVGMKIYNAPMPTIQNVDASDNGMTGIQLVTSNSPTGSNGATLQSSTFARNLVYGIDATSLANGLLKANIVTDTGTVAYIGQAQAGIWSGPGTVADSNVVQRSLLTGLRFEGAGGSVVQNNTVTDSCLGFSDCGAIDTWNGPKRTGWTTGRSSKVLNNTIARAPVDIEGAGAGAPTFNAGIYLDDYSSGVTVTGNSIFDVPVGIVVHNAANNVIGSNKISMSSQASLWANSDQTDAEYMTNNTFSSNQLVPVTVATGTFPTTPVPQQSNAIWFWDKLLGQTAITSGSNIFTGNDIVQLNDTTIPVAWVRSPTGDQYYSAAQWQQFNPMDPAAQSPAQFALYLSNLGPELIVNGDFDSGLGTWTSWFSSATGTRGTVVAGTLPGCTGTCAVYSPQTINDSVYSPPFSMTVGAMYQIGFQAAFAAPGTVSKPGLILNAQGGGVVSTGLTSATLMAGLAGQTLTYQGFFTATSSSPSLLALSASAGTIVGFDNVSLRQVTGYTLSTPSAWAGYAYATTSTPTTVTCASLGWASGCTVMDVNANPVSLPLTIPAFSSKLLLLSNSQFRTR